MSVRDEGTYVVVGGGEQRDEDVEQYHDGCDVPPTGIKLDVNENNVYK